MRFSLSWWSCGSTWCWPWYISLGITLWTETPVLCSYSGWTLMSILASSCRPSSQMHNIQRCGWSSHPHHSLLKGVLRFQPWRKDLMREGFLSLQAKQVLGACWWVVAIRHYDKWFWQCAQVSISQDPWCPPPAGPLPVGFVSKSVSLREHFFLQRIDNVGKSDWSKMSVLSWANIPSVEALVILSQLCWTGYVIHVAHSQTFYYKLYHGKRSLQHREEKI